ncbi:MAG: fumarylacetoacetase [Acidobacteriaceae bacterium]|nr:fumarylacetoacetase [Acidobacteriaceae bacterium]MBV9296236.1 fumarylacetoacetase [Acidobacteriaceae bacterium]
MINETHDLKLQSWVESANRPGCDFPIQNLPLGVFRTQTDSRPRTGVAIGDFVLGLEPWLSGETLNGYLALPATQRRDLRRELSKALAKGSPKRDLIAQAECKMMLPALIGDYTDFYASIEHATNVGRMFRPDNPLLPNYKHVPIAYHGRSSSIVVSGTEVRRPLGQLGEGRFGASKELDYEVELGAFIGPGNVMGEPIPIHRAEQHIAGVCLLNDWSARDIQRWEYQPLGPFLGKNFATSISPWMVTVEALEPFRVSPAEHDPSPPPYLQTVGPASFDITLEVWLRSSSMAQPMLVSQGSFKDMYWTLAQMVAHHTSNGCPLRPGDLIGSGTVSGPQKRNRGCLLEQTWRGAEPLLLPNGETRLFLEDGDEVVLRGDCVRNGFARIGLGACGGRVLPAISYNQGID